MSKLIPFISLLFRPMQLLCFTMSLGVIMSYASDSFAESADKNQPIDLEADTVKVDDAKQLSIYTGNVILTQGTLVIRAEKLIVQEDSQGFQHSTSLGTPNKPTTFKQKREGKNEYMEGSAQRIEYDGRMDKVQLYTRAWVKRGEDIIHGDYIMYDANAEYAEVIGGGKDSANSNAPKGRVRAVIQPKNKAEEPAVKVLETVKPSIQPLPNNTAPASKPVSPQPKTDASPALPPVVKDPRFSRTLELKTDPK